MTVSFLKLNRSMEYGGKIYDSVVDQTFCRHLQEYDREKEKNKQTNKTKHDQYSVIHSFEAVLLKNRPKRLAESEIHHVFTGCLCDNISLTV